MAREKRYLNLTWTDPESGATRERDYPLPVTIGRDTSNSIVLPGAGVSREHCQIAIEGNYIIITDLGSSNGTFLNGAQINKNVLNEGDELTIGETVLKVSFSTTRRATSIDNLFDALTEGEAEATITLKSLKKKDLFADIDASRAKSPAEESMTKTSELPSPDALSGKELSDFLSHGLQKDIEQDIAPDIDKMTTDMRKEHADAMKKMQEKAEAQHAEPQGALNKFMASLRRLFGG